ncbi:WYL domain-containing protein [Phycicoccus sp. M110.8]|uniref:helix-turn-helix transcriptional regulator n=1 Tax=Phycicoccus sp. M110.8 TaxID=3075433 RepID=UPI0028FD2FE4|nr:WYL domain-containing protein [Phycicoccus sp. M110.8]MDU0313778.1 WYL domain-containing protein [Phycicoccus sp. M110.8]
MEPDASPTARALVALELIQSRPGITAERIADRLGVTPRAARRYVATLREAGIPISSVSGPAGGYRPGRGLRPAPLMFTPAETLGLVMAVLDGHHEAGDADDPVGAALAKILRTLPESVAAQADAVRRTTAPAPDRGAARPAPDTTVTLVQACADRRRVRLAYRTEAGRELSLEVEPWAVVVRHSRWYLLCRSVTADAPRTYRVDRVQEAEVLDTTFEPPADLDPVSALEEHLGVGWEFEVEVEVAAPAERVARWLPRTMGRVEAVGAQRCRLVGSTGNPGGYAADLAHLPVGYRVVRGEEVRSATAALAERLRQASVPG